MAVSEKELEEQILEAGTRLLSPPSSVDDLLPLLDELQCCLERVEQSPSKRMLDALSPSINALVADGLLRHLDSDVKVSVATCISEITRITAPDAPYDDDDQMKEILKLIVSSFEKLYDKSNRSYKNRASVLETVARVRSCLLMLDLECDALIIEMFQHFLKSVRDFHREDVFQSMETIMILVLEESEDISLELLSSILLYLKKNSEDVQPIAQKLAEQVLVKCATKVKPYLLQALKSLKISLNDYIKVVANVCQAFGAVEWNNVSKQESKDTLEESHGAKIPSNSDKKVDIPHPSSKASRRKIRNPSFSSPSGRKPEASRSNKVGQGKKKESTIHENTPKYVASKTEDESISVLVLKSSKQLYQKDESVGSKQGDKRRRGKGKSFLRKDITKISIEDKAKECGSLPKTDVKSVKNKYPATSSKKKHTASGEKASQSEEYGEKFVGSKIKVWWPDDQIMKERDLQEEDKQNPKSVCFYHPESLTTVTKNCSNKFYEGLVDSFDHVKKKYKIIYADGDEEILNLKKEKWELIKGDADSDKRNANDGGNLDASPERHMKKSKTNPDAMNNEDNREQLVEKAVGDSSSNKAKATSCKRGRKKRAMTNVDKKNDLIGEDEIAKSGESKDGNTEKTKQETSKNSTTLKRKASNGLSSKGKQRKSGSKWSPDRSTKSGQTGKGKSLKSVIKSSKKRQRAS